MDNSAILNNLPQSDKVELRVGDDILVLTYPTIEAASKVVGEFSAEPDGSENEKAYLGSYRAMCACLPDFAEAQAERYFLSLGLEERNLVITKCLEMCGVPTPNQDEEDVPLS